MKRACAILEHLYHRFSRTILVQQLLHTILYIAFLVSTLVMHLLDLDTQLSYSFILCKLLF